MRSSRILFAILFSTLTAVAQAQVRVNVGSKAPLWDEVKDSFRGSEESRLSASMFRDKIVVFMFWRTTNSESLEALNELNRLHKQFGKLGVTFIAYAPEKQERVKPVAEGKKLEYLWVYREGTGRGLEELYGVSSFPRVFIVDPSGVVAWIGHPADNLEDRIRKQIARTPPSGASSALTKDRMSRAEAAFRKEEFGRAYTLAKSVRDAVEKDTPVFNAAKALIEKCEEGAKKSMTQAAEDFRAERFEEAAKRVAQISVRMAGTDAAKLADEEVAKLRGNSKSKNLIKTAIENVQGEMRNDEAAEFEQLERYPEALAAYRDVTIKYKGTDAFTFAEKAIKRFKEDKALADKIAVRAASETAERWLDLGDRFARLELNTQARKHYEAIVKDYPNTEAAARAKERLAKLPETDGSGPVAEVEEKPSKSAKEKEGQEKDEPGKDTAGKPASSGDKPGDGLRASSPRSGG